MASVSCKNKNNLVFHSKYDPVVECCIEAYFLSSMIFYGVITMLDIVVLIIVLHMTTFVSFLRYICMLITLFSFNRF